MLVGLLASLLLFGIDYYVYRNWKRFVAFRRKRLSWSMPVYRVTLFLMPLSLPVYFYFSRWWQVEPKLPRAIFIGLWAFYFLPKLPIAAVVFIKDLARFILWLFDWFKHRLAVTASNSEPVEVLDLTDMKRMNRADFIRKMGWSVASIPFVVVGYGVFRSLYDFETHRITIPMANLPGSLDGLTIAQISDLHAGSFFSKRPMEEAVSLVMETRPDLVVITGDFVNHDTREFPLIQNAIQRLRPDLGVYGCLGNHDHYADVQELRSRIRNTPVKLLVNEHRTLEIDSAKLHIIGTDNTGFNQHYADLAAACDGIIPDPHGEEVRILLAHDPTFWDAEVRPGYPEIDLTLSGHTHGGQIGFELGPLRWGLAKIAYSRWAGLYNEALFDGSKRQFLYVNRGLGTVGPPVRIGIRPEVTLITLKRV